MIETIESQINIKELTFFEPASEGIKLFSDPRLNIRQDEWSMIEEEALKKERQIFEGETRNHEFLADLALVAPERMRNKFNKNLFWIGLMQNSEDFTPNKIRSATMLKAFFPEKAKNYNFMNDQDWQLLKDEFDDEDDGAYKFLISSYVRLYDSSRHGDFKITDEVFNKQLLLNKDLESVNAYNSLAIQYAFLRIASPHNYAKLEIYPEILEKVWKGLNNDFNEYRGDPKHINKFMGIISSMTIISAKDIKVTDQGLKFTFQNDNEEFKKEDTQIPLIRRF
jgi:hypothetical protein